MQKFISLFLCFFLVACAFNKADTVDTSTLEGLQALANTNKLSNAPPKGKIREMALKELALSMGAQAGLAARADTVNKLLIRHTRNLDAIYDFNSLILQDNVLPPVLLEGRNTLNLADAQTIRISDRVYKIAKQARFITTPPNWRQYLWMDYQKPDEPHVSLLPKTRNEKEVWCFFVEKGWKQGEEQANTILEENIGRIKEDFGGMILYRKLLAMNMVSAPFVSHTDLGVTGDGSEIHIDDKVLRIAVLPALNVNSKEWTAAVAKDEHALKHFQYMEKMIEDSTIVFPPNRWQPVITPRG